MTIFYIESYLVYVAFCVGVLLSIVLFKKKKKKATILVKNLPAIQKTGVPSLGRDGMATHSSILASSNECQGRQKSLAGRNPESQRFGQYLTSQSTSLRAPYRPGPDDAAEWGEGTGGRNQVQAHHQAHVRPLTQRHRHGDEAQRVECCPVTHS